jgi:hypothetical protein
MFCATSADLGEERRVASQEDGPESIAMRISLAAGAGPESAAGRGEEGLPLGGRPASANILVPRSRLESRSAANRSSDGADPLCQCGKIQRPLSIYAACLAVYPQEAVVLGGVRDYG